MADPVTTADAAQVAAVQVQAAAAAQVVAAQSIVFQFMGYSVNLMTAFVFLLVAVLFFGFWKIQKSKKLDFADMVTKDGRAVSLTKVLQLVGGVTATWIMIKLTLTNGLTEALFGLYLAYVGAIEGYSKFVAAKYGYREQSVMDAANIAQVNQVVSDEASSQLEAKLQAAVTAKASLAIDRAVAAVPPPTRPPEPEDLEPEFEPEFEPEPAPSPPPAKTRRTRTQQ